MSQALLLLNGNDTHGKIRSGGVVKTLLAEGRSDSEVLEALFIRCLSRKPTDQEKNDLGALIQGVESKREAFEDVFWALINSKEFIFTH